MGENAIHKDRESESRKMINSYIRTYGVKNGHDSIG